MPGLPAYAALATLLATASLLAACGGGESGRAGEAGRIGAACPRPDTSGSRHVDPAELSGDFKLTMRVTEGTQPDSVVRARLHLEPWTDGGARVPGDLPWIVEGRTTLALGPADSTGDADAPALLTASGSTSRRVVGFWEPHGRSIALVQGTVEDGGVHRAERGVDLRVVRTDPNGFRGTWSSAFWGSPHPSGWFCARRTPERVDGGG